MAINFGSPADFHDLCIAYTEEVAKTVEAAFRLGYHRVAVETYLAENQIFFPSGKKPGEQGKGKSKGKDDPPRDLPLPPSIDVTIDEGSGYNERKLLHRLTYAMSDPSTAYKVSQSKNAKKYDLLAIHPTSVNAFQSACLTQDVDIIQLRIPVEYKLPRKMVLAGARRGVVFELLYSHMLGDRNLRKRTISFAHELYTMSKSKNLIVSSGATTPLDLRAPFDVCNLCELLGLDEANARKCVMANGRAVLLKALGRRTIKGVALIKPVGDNEAKSEPRLADMISGTHPPKQLSGESLHEGPPAKKKKMNNNAEAIQYVVSGSL